MRKLKGSCLCGAVKIELPDSFEYVGSCHCSECRKSSGAANATAGGIDGDLLKIVNGEKSISTYRKSENTELSFCRNCGSTLFTRKVKTGKCNVRLGILDDTPTQKPTFHIFVGSKAPWEEICDGLTQFDTTPPAR